MTVEKCAIERAPDCLHRVRNDRHDQDQRRQFLRGFPPRPDHPPRHTAHPDRRRRFALYGAVRRALRGAIVGGLCQGDRLSGLADRRPAGVSHRVRQNRAGRLAQRSGQPRLRRDAVSGAGVHRRHPQRDLRGDRPQGELQPQNRHRLCPHPRREAGRHRGARIRALGDGAKARRERDGPRRSRAAAADRGRAAAARRGLPAHRRQGL